MPSIWEKSLHAVSKMKNQLNDKADAAAERVKKSSDELANKAKDSMDKAKGTVQDRAQKAADKLHEAMNSTASSAKEMAARSSQLAQAKAHQAAETVQGTIQSTTNSAKELAEQQARNLADRLHQSKEFAEQQASDTAQRVHQSTQDSVQEAKTKADAAMDRAQSLKKDKPFWHMESMAARAKQKLRDSMVNGTQKLREQSSKVVETLDARARVQQMRNRWLALGFSALFVYGVAINTPDAVSKYMIEKVNVEEEAKLRLQKGA